MITAEQAKELERLAAQWSLATERAYSAKSTADMYAAVQNERERQAAFTAYLSTLTEQQP